jgi:uncharacterized protein DUF1573
MGRVWMAAALLVAALAGGAFGDEAAAGPRLAVEPASFDFGSVLSGKEVEKTFMARNVGTQDLVIQDVIPTCGCTVANKADYPKTIKPGERSMIRLKLNVAAPPGVRIEKPVLIKWNNPAGKPYELKLAATVSAPPAPAAQ